MNTIQASELRLGNLFSDIHASDSFYAPVVELRKTRCYYGLFHSVYADLKSIPLNEDWLVRLGGEKLPYHNILNSIFFKVGRNRIVSVGNVGTPNEMIWLCQVNATNDKIIDDLICLRNYDYDGYTPVHTLQNLIHSLTGTELTLTDK